MDHANLRGKDPIDESRDTPRSRFITVNRIRLHYLDWGSPDKLPFVMCHGGSAYAQWWDFVALAFRNRFRVIAPDWRGHGESMHAVPPAYTTQDYVQDLSELTHSLKIKDHILIGHSMGGHNSMVYAADHAERLRALILVDIEPGYPENAVALLRRLGNKPERMYDSLQEAIGNFKVFPRGSEMSAQKLRYLASFAFAETDDGKWHAKLDRKTLFREPVDAWSMLPRITCPTLIVKGEHSPVLTVKKLDRMCASLPDAHWVEVPGTHHHVMHDNPPAFIEVVEQFLKRVL